MGLWEGRAPPAAPVHGATDADAPASEREIQQLRDVPLGLAASWRSRKSQGHTKQVTECTLAADDDANQVPPGWADWD